jgi:hypothetical protein
MQEWRFPAFLFLVYLWRKQHYDDFEDHGLLHDMCHKHFYNGDGSSSGLRHRKLTDLNHLIADSVPSNSKRSPDVYDFMREFVLAGLEPLVSAFGVFEGERTSEVF